MEIINGHRLCDQEDHMGTHMTSLTKVKAPKGSLKTLLEQWTAMVERYAAIHKYVDNCWWYNERATLSSLAGAAWSMENWVALEEFSTRKRHKVKADGMESGDLRPGRCDLYVTNRKVCFGFEAKQAWQRVGPLSNPTRNVHKGLQAAWEDSGHLAKDTDHRFAATFIVPSLPLNAVIDELGNVDPEQVMALLNTWLEGQRGFVRPGGKETSYAYTFPHLGHEGFISGPRYYPGVVLVLEERFRAAKLLDGEN